MNSEPQETTWGRLSLLRQALVERPIAFGSPRLPSMHTPAAFPSVLFV